MDDRIVKIINKWKHILSLDGWFITVESINPKSVTYDKDCPNEDRYFVGIESNQTKKIGTIYHDRDLTERDIIHELLHVKYPKKSEKWVNDTEELLNNIIN